MNTNKSRKACVNCYQKKVRCIWTETSPICAYCLNHSMECLSPDPAQPPQRIAVKDKFTEIDERLRRLEEQSIASINSWHGPGTGAQMIQRPPNQITPLRESPNSVLQELDSLQGPENFIHTGQTESAGSVSVQSNNPNEDSTIEATLSVTGIQPESLLGLPRGNHQERNQKELRSESTPNVRRFRGDTTPWTVLVDGTSKSRLADNPFHSTIMRLAEEESSTKLAAGNINFDFVKEFPSISRDLVVEYAGLYALEAPFQLVHWTDLKQTIERGLDTNRWKHWGEVVTVLLYVAFGSAQSRIAIPGCDCDIYFKKAWDMLSQLLIEQDLWALKGLTLMVHYLQAGALPETCYTLLGSASRMAISLGFHRKRYDNVYTPIEEEEGNRCWWLCFVLEKTFSLVLGRPSTNFDIFDAEIPRPFSTLNDSISTFRVSDGNLIKNDDPNDEEAVALYIDVIEIVHSRDQIVREQYNGDYITSFQHHYSSKCETVAEIISYWRAISHLQRPLDFDTSRSRTLRATICDLCYYNSMISLDRHIRKDFESGVSNESIQAARATINIISGSSENHLTMCMWMWLYYAFSGVVVLFLDVIYNPLQQEATLNLALISDLEKLCTPLSTFSPGAKRVMDVSREMSKVAFDVMKASAKRKAQEDLGNVGIEHTQFKHRRTENAQINSQVTDQSIVTLEENLGQNSTSIAPDIHLSNPFPANFSWDEWDQWLNTAAL